MFIHPALPKVMPFSTSIWIYSCIKALMWRCKMKSWTSRWEALSIGHSCVHIYAPLLEKSSSRGSFLAIVRGWATLTVETVGNCCDAADVLEPVHISEPLNPALQLLQPLSCKAKVSADALHELRAKLPLCLLGSCLSWLMLTGSFSPLFSSRR